MPKEIHKKMKRCYIFDIDEKQLPQGLRSHVSSSEYQNYHESKVYFSFCIFALASAILS